MNLEQSLKNSISNAISSIFNHKVETNNILLQPTKKEFVGNYTFVTFQLSKELKLAPAVIAQQIGEIVTENSEIIASFNVVQGFLNFKIIEQAWFDVLKQITTQGDTYGNLPQNGQKVMVEYSSPNTNKPLHLGHLRNNFLGYSIAQILKANGFDVKKTKR